MSPKGEHQHAHPYVSVDRRRTFLEWLGSDVDLPRLLWSCGGFAAKVSFTPLS